MKDFFDKFQSLKSASFIGIKSYMNSYGEVADVNVLINVDTHEAKKRDLATLKSVTPADLDDIANSMTLSHIYHADPKDGDEFKKVRATLDIALSELIESAEKNLSENKEDRTKQSQAQTDAYIHLTPSVKMHKESMDVYVTGFLQSKKVLVEGEYPERNKREKTKCKDAIKKHCSLRMDTYRPYKVGQMDKINITGDTLQML